MLFCGALVLTLMLSILLRLEAGRARTFGALAFAALAPLLIGSVVLSRFDLWPALLVVAALAALVSDRNRLGAAALGLAIAAKIYPAVLVPVLAVWVWRRAGRREALVCLGVLGGVLLAVFLPFVVLSPHGVWHSLTTQTSRPLQIETLGSGVLLVLHAVAGARGDDAVEPRLAEPRGRRAGRARGPADDRAGGGGDRGLGLVRARTGRPRSARARVRRGGLRLHRLRQGALAAVPDLARAARAARRAAAAAWRRAGSWPPRS